MGANGSSSGRYEALGLIRSSEESVESLQRRLPVFRSPHSFAAGFTISFGNISAILVCALHIVLACEAALKHCWSVMGAGGLRCCFECRNVTLVRSQLDEYGAGSIVSHACRDPSRFVLHTDESFLGSSRQDGEITRVYLQGREMIWKRPLA